MGRPRVLIIDDSVPLAHAFSRALESVFDCVVATSSEAALSALADPALDAIVCDVLMPTLSGAQLHHWLRQTRPEMVRRIVFVTGLDEREARASLGDAASPVLQKPVSMATLRSAVANVLLPAA